MLIMPLTPARRQNTIAWVAARSDGDELRQAGLVPFPDGLARVRAPAGGVAYRPGPDGLGAVQPLEPVRFASNPRQPADDPDWQRATSSSSRFTCRPSRASCPS